MTNRSVRIGIIGAGISGMLMAVKLLQSGRRDFVIFERASKIGGTWRENRYPGVACDVASFAYSYDFAFNPNWARRFATGGEIQQYLETVASKYQLNDYIQFQTSVTSAEFVDGKWHVGTVASNNADNSEQLTFDVLVDATGPINEKKYPAIEGLENFAGQVFHTADWDDSFDYQDKKIAIIGSGSSGVQVTAPLAEAAKQLTLFIRTPQWVMNISNPAYSPLAKKLKHRIPFLGKWARQFYFWLGNEYGKAAFSDGIRRKLVAKFCEYNLNSIKDVDLREKMRPSFEPMCRRMIMSDSYYPALEKSHVAVERGAISHITEKGIVTEDGKLHELDLIVLATGFYPNVWSVKHLVGRNGIAMAEVWKDEQTRNYRSIAMPGFPNFFVMIGPNSPITNLSLIEVADVGANYILQCVDKIEAGEFKTMTVKKSAAAEFGQALEQGFKGTVWVTGCGGWYTYGSSLPQTWPWPAKKFREDLARPNLDHYELSD